MNIDVTSEVVIRRPRTEVAAFMFNPGNDAIWTTGVVECKPLTPGLLTKGAQVERVSKLLGRRFGYRVAVTDHGEGRFVQMHVEQPFEMNIRYELEDREGGTAARIRTWGAGEGFFRVAAPLLSRMVRRSITNDLENLKEYLEGEGAAAPPGGAG